MVTSSTLRETGPESIKPWRHDELLTRMHYFTESRQTLIFFKQSSDQNNKDNILRHDHIFKQEFVDDHLRLSRPASAGLSNLQRSEKPAPNPSNPDIVMHSSPVYNKYDILGHNYKKFVDDALLPASASSVDLSNLQHSEKQASNPSNPDVVMHSPLVCIIHWG